MSAIAQLARKYLPQMPPIYGFDSFEGMSPTDAPLDGIPAQDWAEGTFSEPVWRLCGNAYRTKVCRPSSSRRFSQTSLPLTEYGISKVRFVHIDADIYRPNGNRERG